MVENYCCWTHLNWFLGFLFIFLILMVPNFCCAQGLNVISKSSGPLFLQYAKPSSYSSKSRSSSVKSRDVTNSLTTIAASTSSWNKVYYLVFNMLKLSLFIFYVFCINYIIKDWCTHLCLSLLSLSSTSFSQN